MRKRRLDHNRRNIQLSGNSASVEEKNLDKLVEAERIAKIELIFPKHPDDGLGDGNRITCYMRTDLFQKIQNNERKPYKPKAEYGTKSSSRHYFNEYDRRITSYRWKLWIEGKEVFNIPGVIKC